MTILPAGRTCAWGGAASALFLLEGVHPSLAAVPWLALGTVAALFLVDVLLLRGGRLSVRRALPARLSLDRTAEAALEWVVSW